MNDYRQNLLNAFREYLRREKHPPYQYAPTTPGEWREATINSIAVKHGVRFLHLQGALVLNGHAACSGPGQRTPARPKPTPNPRGRPKSPQMPLQAELLTWFIGKMGTAKLAAHRLKVSEKSLSRWLKSGRGMAPKTYSVLVDLAKGAPDAPKPQPEIG